MERKELNKILGRNIKFLRRNTKVRNVANNKVKYMTQKQLANFMGKDCEQQISKFELGLNELSASHREIYNPVRDFPRYETNYIKIYTISFYRHHRLLRLLQH